MCEGVLQITFSVTAPVDKAELVFAGLATCLSSPPKTHVFNENVGEIVKNQLAEHREHHWAQVMEVR